MVLYLILVSMGITLFWLYFHFMLRKTTFFRLNRWFLLGAMVFCLIMPFGDQFLVYEKEVYASDQEEVAPLYPETIIATVSEVGQNLRKTSKTVPSGWSWLSILYFLVTGGLILRAIYAILVIKRMKKGTVEVRKNGFQLFLGDHIKQPFSFWGNIYLPGKNPEQIPGEILQHEQAHVKHYHFVDIFMAELLTIILWFNPFIFLFKNSVRLNLEYLADEAVVRVGDNKAHYQSMLLSHALQDNFTNPLTTNFTLPLKNRITMMQRKRSNAWRKLAILGIIPVIGLLMAMNTRTLLKTTIVENIAPYSPVDLVNDKPDGSPFKNDQIVRITSHYGRQYHPIYKVEQLHTGIDIKADLGTPIYATADGQVIVAKNDADWGNHIHIKHSDTYETRFGHMSSLAVSPNDMVKKGDLIGYVGNTGKSTGPHLHYEVHVNGEAVNPMAFMDNC